MGARAWSTAGVAAGVAAFSVVALLGMMPIQAAAPPPDPPAASASVEVMMTLYDQETGLWDPEAPWWQSGNALQALLDYMSKTGSRAYMKEEENTIQIQRQPLSWWPQGQGEFRASSTDDTGWWALAMTTMYDMTQNQSYLDIAELGEAYMYSYWDDFCGGGIYWSIKRMTYKNAISIQLLIKLAAALHNRIPGDNLYLSHALQAWQWFNASGMINEENLVNDGLDDDTCENNNQTTWTYNQGVILGGLVELYTATEDESLLDSAMQIADAVITSPELSPDGILAEPCEALGTCNSDQASFKGIFVRNLEELDSVLEERPYRDYLLAQALSAYENGRNETNHYGLHWAGPFDSSTFGISSQDAAVSLLTAVLEAPGDSTSSSPSIETSATPSIETSAAPSVVDATAVPTIAPTTESTTTFEPAPSVFPQTTEVPTLDSTTSPSAGESTVLVSTSSATSSSSTSRPKVVHSIFLFLCIGWLFAGP